MADQRENILQARACPKDCRQCGMVQQMFCSTDLTFKSYEIMSRIYQRLEQLESKMAIMQGSASELVSPATNDEPTDIESQKASGGENRLPKESNN